MNLQKLSGHTIDVDRLQHDAVVLDVGCRGFGFSKDILRFCRDGVVIALDPAPDVLDPCIASCKYMSLALVGDNRARAGFAHFSNGDGDFITHAQGFYDAEMMHVSCVNIQHLSIMHGVEKWDAVKLDCEGSEFQILENWPGPIADQISVEFHDWQDKEKRDGNYYETLFEMLGKFGYRVIQHELSDISGRGAVGHWDSLLVLSGT